MAANKICKTASGVEISLRPVKVFNFDIVAQGNTVKGIDANQDKVSFSIIAKTKKFIICRLGETDQEFVFNQEGIQLATFQKYRLTSPLVDRYEFPLMLLVDKDNIIQSWITQHSTPKTMYSAYGYTLVNRTQNANKTKLIAELNGLGEDFIKGYSY